MNDLELHNLIRDSLKDFKPEYNHGHWQLMQFKLITAQVIWPLKLLAPIAVPAAIVGALLFNTQSADIDSKPEVLLTKLRQKAPVELTFEQQPMNYKKVIPFIPLDDNQLEKAVDHRQQIAELDPLSYGITSSLPAPSPMRTYFVEREITTLLRGNVVDKDSTTYKVLERNKEKWSNAVVVCDWTSSMFRYGTQIFAWLNNNQNNQGLKGYVFFNDCNDEGRQLTGSNSVGAMYHTVSKSSDHVLNTMITAVRNGMENTDLQENDLEAIQFAVNEFPNVEEVILIADNRSPVRWPDLMKTIDRPVRVILCGSTITGEAIQQDYIDLARSTRGSIHTMEDDLEDLTGIPNGRWLKVGDTFYRYHSKKDTFIPTQRRKRPKNKDI